MTTDFSVMVKGSDWTIESLIIKVLADRAGGKLDIPHEEYEHARNGGLLFTVKEGVIKVRS